MVIEPDRNLPADYSHRVLYSQIWLSAAITEADMASGEGEDFFRGPDAPVKIASQIDEHHLAGAHGFAIHHPGYGVMIWQDQSSRFDVLQQLRLEKV